MTAMPTDVVVRIDPESADILRGLTGRMDKLIEIVERLEKVVVVPAELESVETPRCANWERLPDSASPYDASVCRG